MDKFCQATLFTCPRIRRGQLLQLYMQAVAAGAGGGERQILAAAAGILTADQLSGLREHWRRRSPEWLAERCRQLGAEVIVIDDREYPLYLRSIHRPPLVLFCRGRLPVDGADCLAVVGMRRASAYGRQVASQLARQLAERGVTIVSGAARGIDTAAHQGALAADGGRTVAVLGCGLDYVYPPENRRLLADIAERGAVVSEYLPGTRPFLGHFPQRNRIISGLCWGTLVVEAAERSGALITADFALEQGREVYAVPGPVTGGNSRGCHWLIKQGAKLVDGVDDIAGDYRLPAGKGKSQTPPDLTVDEKMLYDCLRADRPLAADELIEMTGMPAARMSAALMGLVLKDAAVEHPGQMYSRGW
ncbi:MAG: DNA-processing protein DprA [Negativicutes bacterium]|nr:DNA-processing protein DprA [Negativicutes bacterium]